MGTPNIPKHASSASASADWLVCAGYRRCLRPDGIIETIITDPLPPEETAMCIKGLVKFAVNNTLRELVKHETSSIITADYSRIQLAVDAARETFAIMTSVHIAFVVQTDLAFALCRQMTMNMEFPNTHFLVARDEKQAEIWLKAASE